MCQNRHNFIAPISRLKRVQHNTIWELKIDGTLQNLVTCIFPSSMLIETSALFVHVDSHNGLVKSIIRYKSSPVDFLVHDTQILQWRSSFSLISLCLDVIFPYHWKGQSNLFSQSYGVLLLYMVILSFKVAYGTRFYMVRTV